MYMKVFDKLLSAIQVRYHIFYWIESLIEWEGWVETATDQRNRIWSWHLWIIRMMGEWASIMEKA